MPQHSRCQLEVDSMGKGLQSAPGAPVFGFCLVWMGKRAVVSVQFSWHDFADSSMAKLPFPHCSRYAECRCGCAAQQLLLLAYVVSLAGWNNNHDGKPSSTGLSLLVASTAPSPSYSPVTVAIGTCRAWAGHWAGAILLMHGCRKCRDERKAAQDLGSVRIRQHCFHIYPWFVGSVVSQSSKKLSPIFHFKNY